LTTLCGGIGKRRGFPSTLIVQMTDCENSCSLTNRFFPMIKRHDGPETDIYLEVATQYQEGDAPEGLYLSAETILLLSEMGAALDKRRRVMILAFAKIYKSRLPINDRTQLRLPSMEDVREQGRWRWIGFRFEPAHYAGVPLRRDILPPRRGTSQRERCRSH